MARERVYMGIPSVGGGFSALQSATQGINRGLAGLDRDAQAIAHTTIDPQSTVDVTAGALVDSLENKLLVQMNARMLSVADETLGSLLDVTA